METEKLNTVNSRKQELFGPITCIFSVLQLSLTLKPRREERYTYPKGTNMKTQQKGEKDFLYLGFVSYPLATVSVFKFESFSSELCICVKEYIRL